MLSDLKIKIKRNFKEIDAHSDAFATGVLELGFKKGDKFLFWVDKANTSEITVAQAGLAKAGVSIVIADIQNEKQLEDALKETECKGLLFSPSIKIGDRKAPEILAEVISELEKSRVGAPNNFQKYSKLKYLVHTGFYSQPGAIKYKNLLVYARPSFNTHKISEDVGENDVLFHVKQDGNYKSYTQGEIHSRAADFRKTHNIADGDSILVVGDTNSPATFAYGSYNAIAHGNLVILSGNDKFNDTITKLNAQKANFVIINDEISKQDLKSTLDESAVKVLKNIIYRPSSTVNEDLISSIFGGKKRQSIST